MASRRDQLHSYQFMQQRMVSAFVYRDVDLAQAPFRRAGGTLFLSVMLAVLALAAVGVYGVVAPGGKTSWRNEKAIIVEKETGARYVYLGGALHPVLNYASARLIIKQSDAPTVLVSSASLRDAPRAAPLGISGAPDSLPDRSRLLTEPWTLCSRPGSDESGRAVVSSVLFVSGRPARGRDLAGNGLLARSPTGSVYLVWNSHRFLVADPQIVLNALGLGQAPVHPVALPWINAVAPGPDLRRVSIAKRGAPSAVRDGRVGQVAITQSESGETQYYAVLEDGIADITPVQADILLNDPETVAAYAGQPTAIRRGDLVTAKRSATRLLPSADAAQPPVRTPQIADAGDDGALCATFPNAADPPQISVDARLTGVAPTAGPPSRSGGAGAFADRVVVPPGSGVLVQARISPNASGGSLSVVTDLGLRYPLASGEVRGFLGYDKVSALSMPAGLVALVPTGPPLDPAAATVPVGNG